jgi:hypothetical protein
MSGDMAKPQKSKEPEIEIDPEAFERFRSAVHKLAKSGPKHREAPTPKRTMGSRAKPIDRG